MEIHSGLIRTDMAGAHVTRPVFAIRGRLFSFLAALGFLIGFSPALIVADRWWVWVGAAGLGAGMAYRELALMTTTRPEAPASGELAAGTVYMVLFGSLYSLAWLAVRAVAFWATRAANALFEISGDPQLLGFWISLGVVSVTIMWTLGLSIYTVASDLYPYEVGRPLPLAHHTDRRVRFWLLLAVALVGITISYLIAGTFSTVGITLLQIVVFVIGASAVPDYEAIGRDPALDAQRLADRLEALGYSITLRPVTGDPGLDPLLGFANLLAVSPDRSMVFDVRSGTGHPLDWTDASGIMTASRILTESAGDQRKVEPVLVLIERTPTPNLLNFAEQNPLTLVQVDLETNSVSVTKSPSALDLEIMGHEYLQDLPKEPDSP